MRNPPIRTPKFDLNTVADPAQIYDKIFFIDQMHAATKVRPTVDLPLLAQSGHGIRPRRRPFRNTHSDRDCFDQGYRDVLG